MRAGTFTMSGFQSTTARGVELHVNATSNCFEGIVADLTYTGPETQISVKVANVSLKAVVPSSIQV